VARLPDVRLYIDDPKRKLIVHPTADTAPSRTQDALDSPV